MDGWMDEGVDIKIKSRSKKVLNGELTKYNLHNLHIDRLDTFPFYPHYLFGIFLFQD